MKDYSTLETHKKYPPNKLTYLAFEETLRGKKSKEVSKKDLRLIVRAHEDPSVQALIRQYGASAVAGGARELLLKDVFKHQSHAEEILSKTLYFTDSESESEAGRASGSAGGEAARNRPQLGQPGTMLERVEVSTENFIQTQWQNEPLLWELTGVRRKKEWKGKPIPDYDSKNPLSPQPVVLPFRIQHLLLSNFIQVLENSCYDYAVVHAPKIVEDRRYECFEESELQSWTNDFSRNKTFHSDDKEAAAHREVLLTQVARMRHNVVHRERAGVDAMAQYFCSAEELSTLMGDTATRNTILCLWKAIEPAAYGLMQDTMVKFREHSKTMDLLKSEKDELDAQRQGELTGPQQAALDARREAVLVVEKNLISQAHGDYRTLSQAAGRAVEQAISEHGITLGSLGVWLPPQDTSTIAKCPREYEIPSMEAAVSKFAFLRAQDAEKNVRGSLKEAEGARGVKTPDQPSKTPADVKGKRKEEPPYESRLKMREQKQDVHGGGITIKGQEEPSAKGKITLLSKEEWRALSAERGAFNDAAQRSAPVNRDASFPSKRAHVTPEEGENPYSANAWNAGGYRTKQNEGGSRTEQNEGGNPYSASAWNGSGYRREQNERENPYSANAWNGRGYRTKQDEENSRTEQKEGGSRTKRKGPPLESQADPWFRSGK
ncbi:unnamed protein product [Clonostachys rosea]|uniref:Uncharacterized protein n=1 Tax=Bionectria ochroleuca TaxID=29856 RepID=A0ABY6ULW4_BIOOC|nr:unnamed protein product [Clonostachys rosea]